MNTTLSSTDSDTFGSCICVPVGSLDQHYFFEILELLRTVNESKCLQMQDNITKQYQLINSCVMSDKFTALIDNSFLSLIQLSTQIIPSSNSTQQQRFFKMFQNLLGANKSSVENWLESWFKEIYVSQELSLNQVIFLSRLLHEVDQVVLFFIEHVLELFSLTNWTLLKQMNEKSVASSELRLKCSRFYLQLFRTFKDQIADTLAANINDDEVRECFVLVADCCFNVIDCSQTDCLTASKFCSNVIAHVLCFHDSIDRSHEVLKNLLSVKDGASKTVEIMPGIFIEEKNITSLQKMNFWIVYGVLSCCSRILFYEFASSQFIAKSFSIVFEVCSSNVGLQFQGFSALQSWYKNLLISACEAKSYIDDEVVSMTLDLVWNNWDSQVAGAIDILLQVFRSLLDVLASDHALTSQIMLRLLNTPAHVKGRYGPLCLCINKFGYQTILDVQPRFTYTLIEGLGVNHLASSVSKVYKAIASSAFSKKIKSFDISKWETLLGRPLVTALLHDSTQIQQNALSYMVPVNICLNSSVLPRLLQCILDGSFVENNTVDAKLSAVIGILKVARSSGKVPFNQIDKKIIQQAFSSYQNETRACGFWVVCKAPKKSDMVSQEELEFLYEHIPLNMNIDCAAFRHEFVSCISTILDRTQCSVLALTKRFRSVTNLRKNSEYFSTCMKFVSWLLALCLDSLHTCFTYQRKVTALSIYKLILQRFSCNNEAVFKMEALSKSEIDLLANIVDESGIKLLSISNASCLLNLVQDVVPEIRQISIDVLISCFPFSILSQFRTSISNSFMSLLNSPKAQVAECGSVVVQFYFNYFIGKKGVEKPSHADENFMEKFDFLQLLFCNVKENFKSFRENFLLSSYQRPLHGWFLVFSNCFQSFPYFEKLDSCCSERLRTFLVDTSAMLSDIVHFFLNQIFSCSADTPNQYTASADFREMSVRICKLISEFSQSSDKETLLDEDILLSQDFEVILSSSWLALKNCCLCSSSVGCFFLRSSLSSLFSVEQIKTELERISSLFVTVLSMCRHKGVIESCYSSFVTFLTSLFNSPTYSSLPSALLASLLESQSQRRSDTQLIKGGSITRRSAGLPSVIDAILSANVAASHNSEVLVECVSTLLGSLIYLKELDEKQVCLSADLPQVDALYILKSIVQNNKLGPLLTTLLPSVFIASLDCLSSSLWIVRNAATCLLGILASRLLGQQHMEKKFTNSLAASEFFFRYPKLLTYFRNIFKYDIKMSREASSVNQYFFKPSIYPIISILSKLAYEQNSSKQNIDLSFITDVSVELLICRFFFVRTIAAELLLSLHSPDHIITMICGYLGCLEASSLPKNFRQNELHGWLNLTVMVIKKIGKNFESLSNLPELCRTLSVGNWLAFLRQNFCPLTAAMYLNVVVLLLENDCKTVANIDTNQLLVEVSNQSYSSKVGYCEYVEACIKYLIALEEIEVLNKLLHLELTSNRMFCHRFCFEYLAKSESLMQQHDRHFITFIVRMWKTATYSLHLLVEKEALNFLIKLQGFDERYLCDQLPVISDHIFSNSYSNCLSLKCLRIKSMSWTIFWETKTRQSNESILQHVDVWADELCESTFVARVSEPQRLSAAKSFYDFGADILCWIKQLFDIHAPDQVSNQRICLSISRHKLNDELLKIAASLFYSSVLLLHDEQSEVREPVCGFVAQLHGNENVSTFQHNYATEVLLSYFVSNFSSMHLINRLMKICAKVTVPSIKCSDQGLFQQEAFNLYVQFDQLALTFKRFIQDIVAGGGVHAQKDWICHNLKEGERHLIAICNLKRSLDWSQILQYGVCGLVFLDIIFFLARSFIEMENLPCSDIRELLYILQDESPSSVQRLVGDISTNYFEKPNT